jgi:hypothetical protein
VSRNREIKKLEFEIEKKRNPTNRDLVIFAYHFVRLEHPLLAQKYLNRLSPDYFDSGIYKDLCAALLAWSVVQANPLFKNASNDRAYEFFVVIKRIMTMFTDINFESRTAFRRFKVQFLEYSKNITLPNT